MNQRALFLIVFASAIAVSQAQDLFVSSEGSNSVKQYNGTTGAYIRDFVTANSGGLNRPQGLTWGPDGNLYVSSVASGQVLRYNGQTGAFIDVFTQGPAMAFAADMDWHNGFLFVSDFTATGHVNKYDGATGAFLGQFTEDNYATSDGISWDASGNMYVSSFGANNVRKYDSSGHFLSIFANSGGLTRPLDSRFDAAGNFYVNDFDQGSVKKFDANGVFQMDFVTGLTRTQGQAIGPDGSLYVGSYSGGYIKKFNALTGADMGVFATGGGLLNPNNFAFQPVPEPTTMAVLAAGLILAARKKRWR